MWLAARCPDKHNCVVGGRVVAELESAPAGVDGAICSS